MASNKNNMHFVDSDITGTSGTGSWSSNNFQALDPAKTQIWNVADLLAINDGFAEIPPSGGGDFRNFTDYELMVDLDMTGVTMADGLNPNGGFIGGVPEIGETDVYTFSGTFDGRGHTISNLTLDWGFIPPNGGAVPIGLFAKTIDATITNLHLRNANYIFNGANRGGLLCGFTTTTTMFQCSVEGSLTLKAAGVQFGGTIRVGGLYGGTQFGQDNNIQQCYAKVDLINIVAPPVAKLFQCGGFAGRAASDLIRNCYCEGSITDPQYNQNVRVNWLYGFSYDTLDNATDIDNVWCAMTHNYDGRSDSIYGGFADDGANDNIKGTFWDGTIAFANSNLDNADDSNATESTTTAMFQEATFVGEGGTPWDFTDIWSIDEGNDYPRLIWELSDLFPVVNGTQERTIAFPTNHAHLEAEVVQVLGDGNFLGTDTVSSGEITLDDQTTVNHVGLAYTSALQPSKPDGEAKLKKITKLVLQVFESLTGRYGKALTELFTIKLRDSGDPMDSTAALNTGHIDLPFKGEIARQGDIWITQPDPLPMNVIGMAIFMGVEDK